MYYELALVLVSLVHEQWRNSASSRWNLVPFWARLLIQARSFEFWAIDTLA